MQIVKALYELKSSGARWHDKFADAMRDDGWFPCKAEPDSWMKYAGDHYEITSVYVDDTLCSSNDPTDFTKCLTDKNGFEFKNVDELHYFLGAKIERSKKTGGF